QPISGLTRSPTLTGASWGEDNTIVFAGNSFGIGLRSIPASGGQSRDVTSLDTSRGDLMHQEPSHLPGERGLLYTTTRRRIILRSRDGNEKVLITDGRSARFVTSGHIV